MAMAAIGGRPKRIRTDPIGTIGGKGSLRREFNNFPAIAAAFPGALSDIVVETTEHLGTLAQARAPQQGQSRGRPHGSWNGRPDVAPGTLRRSKRVRFARRRGTDLVVTGRVDFKAVDPTRKDPKHTFAKAVETGSVRTNASIGKGGGHYYVRPQPFLVPAVINERPIFIDRIADLERRLPR
ncbi:MAG: hypothetical protein H0W41_06700 [Chloroflexi bacterium]|nr:hypothetical protein [Chloroflexota bacterium]